MLNSPKIVGAYLDSQELNWTYTNEEETIIRMGAKMDNITVEMFVDFDDDDTSVNIMGRGMGNIPLSKLEKGYELINKTNENYRWIKFYIDTRDGEIMAQIDAVIQLDSCGEEVTELLFRMARIMDKAYNEIMEGLWAK